MNEGVGIHNGAAILILDLNQWRYAGELRKMQNFW